jgi:hypothetical protein
MIVADDIEDRISWVRWVGLGVLGVLSLACIVTGGIFYGWIFADWMQGSGGFRGLQMIGWLVGLAAAAVIGAGLVFAGLFLRFLPWVHAPLASLLLAVVSAGFILFTYLVYSDTGNGGDSIEVVLLQAGCIIGLFIGPLPPFLHWLLAKRRKPIEYLSKAS